MPPSSDIVAPVGAEHNTLYVAIEISRKSWVIGIESPASERIGLHSLGAADVVGLKDLIEHQQTKAERALGREVRVLCCYERDARVCGDAQPGAFVDGDGGLRDVGRHGRCRA